MNLQDNRYYVQDVDLLELTEKYGTPLYVYDGERIVEQYHKLKDSFTKVKTNIKYASKALTNLAVLQLLKREGCGLDAVSIQEVHLGIQAGFQPQEILFTPNCVAFEEIKEAVQLGVKINIDNISVLEQFGHEYHDTVPVCIRLNPHIMAGGHQKISTGHIDSKFGISVHQLRHLLRVVSSNNLNVEGLHMHTGSDILDPEVFIRGAEIIFEAARNFPALNYIDFGSGFKVAYREGDVVTDIPQLAARIEERFLSFCKEYGKELELWFEPGKYLVSESGLLLVRTNVIKTTPATVFAGVDSGMNHLLRPMMYDAYHDIVNITNTQGTRRVYTVVGYICETDTFGWDRKLNEVREGDVLAIKNAGAYGFSMASNYNSRFRPAEVLIHNGKAHLIRKRETMQDLLYNQVPVEWE